MKTLIFALIFSSTAIAQQQQNQPEIRLSESEISNKLISVARDIENERILEGIPDFQRCKQQFAFQAGEDTAAMRQRAAQATTCFQQALQGKNSPQEIAAISDKLNLQAYKLIPSKSVQEVTKYLTNKMYKSLTGIDYEEDDVKKRIESLKFNKNKKIVDQKQFIILYKNQIAKNALSEVSRFCFEDFRKTGPTTPAIDTSSFFKHWENEFNGTSTFQAATVSDNGASTPFGQTASGSGTPARQDRDSAYQSIVNSMFPAGTTVPSDQILSQFYIYCGTQINKLCDDFEKTLNKNGNTPGVVAADASGNATAPSGAKACLAKSRIVSLKKALKASDLIIADFNTNGGGNAFKLLDNRDELVKVYGSGQDRNEKSVNEITNSSSLDFFTATENEDTQRAQNCATSGSPVDCDEFVIVDDSRNRIQYNLEIEYSAKREAEIARVRRLKQGDEQPLLEYLKANGYLAAAEAIEKGTSPPPDLEALVGQAWEAKKLALQAEIQGRLGKRQITQAETQDASGNDQKVAFAQNNARETLNERARLARVVFFNNIISSNLNLQTQSGTSLGRNSQALSGELDSLENQVAGNLFQNLRTSLGTNGNGGQTRSPSSGESITDITFLDQFLGGAPQSQTGSQGQSQRQSPGRSP